MLHCANVPSVQRMEIHSSFLQRDRSMDCVEELVKHDSTIDFLTVRSKADVKKIIGSSHFDLPQSDLVRSKSHRTSASAAKLSPSSCNSFRGPSSRHSLV